jgi:hypothetical protein
LKLLLIGNDFVAEHRFVAFEERWATKDTEVGKAGLALVAELIWSCWDSIYVSDILSWTDVASEGPFCLLFYLMFTCNLNVSTFS